MRYRNLVASIAVLMGLAAFPCARAQTGSAAPLPADRFLLGPGVEAQARQQQRLGQSVMSAISEKSVAVLSSPTLTGPLTDLGGQLRHGAHKVVSPDGEHVVNLVRMLATANPARQQQLLSEIGRPETTSVPEAINFFGFASEYGLFGFPRDARKAQSLYEQSARGRYQPALYNRGLAAAYGRDGPQDLAAAAARLDLALAAGPESSGRVCGLGAFVNIRRKSLADASRFAEKCPSPLATIATEWADGRPLTRLRIERLRATAATGVDDGLYLLEALAKRTASVDLELTYCKYDVLNTFRRSRPGSSDPKLVAQRCAEQSGPTATSPAERTRRDQALAGVASFVTIESARVDHDRSVNHFHYGWSVPYLPFPQTEMALFEPLVLTALQRRP